MQNSQSGFRYVNYTNVRYAAPPIGIHRFSAPQEPTVNNTLQTASDFQIQCSQATAGWENYVGVDVGNLTRMPVVSESDISLPVAGEREDCLFLDVLVPESVFLSRTRAKVPVVVFLHGGGYAEGSKTAYGPGTSSGIGLLEAATENGKAIVYVAINYRLGAFVSLVD